MLGREQLALLRPGAVVVNDARGPIIDLDALAELMRAGHIAGAGLDVLPVEPPVEPIPELLRAYRAQRAMARRPPRDHAAFGLADAAFLGGHAAEIGRDDARRAVDQPAAERHHAGDVLGPGRSPMHRLHLLRHAKSSSRRRRGGSRAPAEPARPRGGAPRRREPAGGARRHSTSCCARPRGAPARPPSWRWPASQRRRASCYEDGLYLAGRAGLAAPPAPARRERRHGPGDRPQSRAARAGAGARRSPIRRATRSSPPANSRPPSRASFAIDGNWADLARTRHASPIT